MTQEDTNLKVVVVSRDTNIHLWEELLHGHLEGRSIRFSYELQLSGAVKRLHDDDYDLLLIDRPSLESEDEAGEIGRLYYHEQLILPVIVLCPEYDIDFAVSWSRRGINDIIAEENVSPPMFLQTILCAIERFWRAEELVTDHELLSSVLDNIPERIFFKDSKSRFLRVNQGLLDHFKEPDRKNILGKTDFDFFDKAHAQAAFDDEQRIMRSHTPIVGKIEKEIHVDGRVGFVSTTKVPFFNHDGKVVGLLGISRDISELKALEEALDHENHLLRALIDHLPESIFAKDDRGRYIISNPSHAKSIAAVNMEAVLGKTCYDFFPSETAKAIDEQDKALLAEGRELIDVEEERSTVGGEIQHLLTSRVPFYNKDGETVGLVGINRDITALKQRERELLETNRTLAEKESDLTDALKELQEAQLLLIEAEKMKTIGRLAAGIAHDIKNPLAVLSMGIDYLWKKTSREDEALYGLIEDMRSAVERADTVIFDILDFAKPSKLDMEEASINEVVKRTLVLIEYKLKQQKIALKQDLQTDLPDLLIDGCKIEQALLNIVMNAVNAMPGGDV